VKFELCDVPGAHGDQGEAKRKPSVRLLIIPAL